MRDSTYTLAGFNARSGDRRHVSVLFTDMVGYTEIIEGLGEEKALAFTQMLFDRLTTAVRAQGGVVRSFTGDSIMAVFGVPYVLEDAAIRACRAAAAIHAAFDADAPMIDGIFGVRPLMRVGISSGAVILAAVEGDGAQMTAVGNTVNLASRIQSKASGGTSLMCDVTRSLVEWRFDLELDGHHRIKGIDQPHKLWWLGPAREGATRFDASRARGLSDLVGRDAELDVFQSALDRARNQRCTVDMVAGAGLGKTRLAFEFLKTLDAASVSVIKGQCTADAQQTPFYPFIQILRQAFRIASTDDAVACAAKLMKNLLAMGLYSPENMGLILNLLGMPQLDRALDGLDSVLIGVRTRGLISDVLASRCRTIQVVLVIGDIHWIDYASEDMLRTLIERGPKSNLLVLHTRRPEYKPAWTNDPTVKRMALAPLEQRDMMRLIQTCLQTDDVPAALMGHVIDRAGGNPLFAEELLRFMTQKGVLTIEQGKAGFDAAAAVSHAMPESLHRLLGMMIDRLTLDDRALLQAAAAIGNRFDARLLAAVMARPAGVRAGLLSLEAKNFIRRLPGTAHYTFTHVLQQDAVYYRLLSDHKAALHLAIAKALEAGHEDWLLEIVESLAHHYGLTDHTQSAFKYNLIAARKSLGLQALKEANGYFASALVFCNREGNAADPDETAAFWADYALSLNLSLEVKTMIALADDVSGCLLRHGDSLHHVQFLYHFAACLIWNGRYRDALKVVGDLTEMAQRLGSNKAFAYAHASGLLISCFYGHLSNKAFDAKRIQAQIAMVDVNDARLTIFFAAINAWNEVERGRVQEAHRSADQMISDGTMLNDPRLLGYGNTVKALIAMRSNDFDAALGLSERALALPLAPFERALATTARCSALLALGKPGAVEETKQFFATCADNGWHVFPSGLDAMLGVVMAREGRITQGIAHITRVIRAREADGYVFAANWCRLFLCEVYLEVLSAKGRAPIGVVLRNLRALLGIKLFGAKRIKGLIAGIRAAPYYDAEAHYNVRIEMISGLLCKLRKRDVRAVAHLDVAKRLLATAGPSPLLNRVNAALTALGPSRRK